jgi:hypothetical protein
MGTSAPVSLLRNSSGTSQDPDYSEIGIIVCSTPGPTDISTQHPSVGELIDIQRFSSIHKLYRVTAYVLKFMKLLRKRVTSPELTHADLSEAETLWILDAQSSMVQDQNFPKWKVQFGLFQDESQIWR